MDGAANCRPNQGAAPAASDWRAHLCPEARHRIVNRIMEVLKKRLSVLLPEQLNDLQKIAVRFEEKIYVAAVSQSDYLRKISIKLLTMETQYTPANASVIQTTRGGGSDWKEEIYQKIKNVKDQYNAELQNFCIKIARQIQQVDEQYKKLKLEKKRKRRN